MGKAGKIFIIIMFLISFGCIGFLGYRNYVMQKDIETLTELYNNLYAETDSFSNDGSHVLSISDIFYKKHFTSEN